MLLAVRVWPWVLALLVLLPVLGPGYVLSYDMVFVPDLAMRSDFLGLGTSLPRAVPSDALVAVLDQVLSGMLLQKVVLVAALVLAGVGARRLVPADNGVAQLAATSFYVWNGYVAERLGIGHWPLLLAYAALPWVFAAARRLARGERTLPVLVLWLALGATSASGGVMTGVLAVVCVMGRGRAALRRTAVVALCALGLNAPWIVAGALHASEAVSDSAAAVTTFAARGEGHLPMPLAALDLGGIWNLEVVPASRLGWAGVAALLLTVVVCGVGWRAWRAWLPVRDRTALVAAAAVGFVVAATGALLPQVTVWFAHAVPGGGLLRDGARFLGLLAPVETSLFGVGAGVVAGLMRERVGRVALAAGVVLMPLALMPDLAWGLLGALRPVEFPQEYAAARQALGDRVALAARRGESGGALLVLPFTPYRAPAWNHGRPVLDPTGRYLPLDYVASDVLYVDGRPVPGEDPRVGRIGRLLASDLPPRELATELAGEGIRWLALDEGSRRAGGGSAISPRLEEASTVFEGQDLKIWELPRTTEPRSVAARTVGALVTAWVLAIGLVGAAVVAIVRRRPTWRIWQPRS